MDLLFSEPELRARKARSYVDLPTNVGFIARLSARRDLGHLYAGGLPVDVLPAFLHEATHHWCFHSTLGFAIAGLYQRAVVNAAIVGDAAHGEFQLSPKGPAGLAELEHGLDDLRRFEVAFGLLQPLMEGLALFSEFDVQPVLQDVNPPPFALATSLFATPHGKSPEMLWSTLRDLLAGVRASPEVVQRKYQVLLAGLSPSTDPYLAGYLSLKAIWSAAASHRGELADSCTFLTFVRNYIFEDLELVHILLQGKSEQQKDGQIPFAGALATRLRDRAVALHLPETYASFDQYLNTIRRVVEAPPAPDRPFPPELSLSEPGAAGKGWSAIRDFVREFEEKSRSKGPEAQYWCGMQAALNQRSLQVLDMSAVYVRITPAGVCSVWQNAAATTPLLTGARCRASSLYGQEGDGYVVMATSADLPVGIFAVVLNGEVAFDTIAGQTVDGSAGNLRAAVADLPRKLLLSDVSESLVTALFRQGDPERTVMPTNVGGLVDQIYLALALPWLREPQRSRVASLLAQNGVGLAALLPEGKWHLLKIFVTLSLGGNLDDESIDQLFAESNADDSIPDVLERINDAARAVWGREIVYLQDGEIRGIRF